MSSMASSPRLRPPTHRATFWFNSASGTPHCWHASPNAPEKHLTYTSGNPSGLRSRRSPCLLERHLPERSSMPYLRTILAVCATVLSFAAQAEKLTIAAAADLKFAMDDLANTYRKANPGYEVDVIY